MVYAGYRSTEVINILCDSVRKWGIYRQATSKNAQFPSSEITGLIKKNKGVRKIVRTPSIIIRSLVEIRRCTAAWEKTVGSIFLFFCCCLFVMIWILNFHKGLAHQMHSHSNNDIFATYMSILMLILAFFIGRKMLCQTFQNTLWRHICLKIASKFEFFFWKFEEHSLCARLRPFRRKKFHNSLLVRCLYMCIFFEQLIL